MLDDVAHRDADADNVFGEAEHLEEARIEQHDAMLGIDRAKPVRHVIDRLVEALELHAHRVVLALALGDVLDQRHPSAAGDRAIVHREGAPARHLAQQAERQPARHHVGAAALDQLELRGREISLRRRMRDQVGHRHADARDLRREVVHFEEALVEEHEPLLRIDHAQAMRHAGERRLVQRKQFLELTRLISLNGV